MSNHTTTPAPARPALLTIVADHTPGVHSTVDFDQLWWYAPILGPSSLLIALQLARRALVASYQWDVAELGANMGLALATTWSTIDRLTRFHVLDFVSTDVATVRLYLPELAHAWLQRLKPDHSNAYITRDTRVPFGHASEEDPHGLQEL